MRNKTTGTAATSKQAGRRAARLPGRIALAGAVAVAAVALTGRGGAPVPVASQPRLTKVAATATSHSASFRCVGFSQSFLVPPDVSQLNAEAVGGVGSIVNPAIAQSSIFPGKAADVSATIPVTPGQKLTVTVACAAQSNYSNEDIRHLNDKANNNARYPGGYGYSTGGAGGGTAAGAGGGSTGIANATAALLVAGGGGGYGGRGTRVGAAADNGGLGTGGDATPLAGGPGGIGFAQYNDTPGAGGQPGRSSTGNGLQGQDESGNAGSGGGGGAGCVGGGGGGAGVNTLTGGGGGAGGSSCGGSGVAVTAMTVASSILTPASLHLSWTSSLGDYGPVTGTCTNARNTYTVPTGVDQVQVTAIGAPGGRYNGGSGDNINTTQDTYASHGAGTTTIETVSAGDVLSYGVGCEGGADPRPTYANASAGSFNGVQGSNPDGGFGWSYGGAGGQGSGDGSAYGLSGCGGGGSTAVASGSQVLAEGGGGGGCGGFGGLFAGDEQAHGGDAPGSGSNGAHGVNAGSGGSGGTAGNQPNGDNAAVATGASGGGGGGGSSAGPGGHGQAGDHGAFGLRAGTGDGGAGGGGLSQIVATSAPSGNLDSTPWWNTGALSGLLIITPYHLVPQVDVSITSMTWSNPNPAYGDSDTLSVTVYDRNPTVKATNVKTRIILPGGNPLQSEQVPGGTSYDPGSGIWTIPTLAGSFQQTISLTVKVGTYGNQLASAQVTADQVDPNLANNIANAAFVTQAADVGVLVSVDDSSANPNQLLTLTLTTFDNGPLTAQGVVTTDTLPAGLTYVGLGTPTQGTATRSGSQITWTLGTLAPPKKQTLTVQVRYTAAQKTVIDMVSTTSTSPVDGTPGNNHNQVVITPSNDPADLAVTVQAGGDVLPVAFHGRYLVTVTNNGPNVASGIVIDNTLTADEEQISSITQYPFDGAAPVAADTTNDYPKGPVLHWRPPVLQPGGAETLDIEFTLTPGSGGAEGYSDYPAATLTAVRAASTQPDNNPANDRASAGYNLVAYADVQPIAFTTTPNPAPGTSSTAMVYASDNGPADAHGVVETITIPAGLTLVSATPSLGTSYDASTGTWTIGTIISGQYPELTLVLTPTDTLLHRVAVHISSTSPADNNHGNDNTSFTVQRATFVTSPPPAALPETPYVPLLALVALPIGWLALRRRRR